MTSCNHWSWTRAISNTLKKLRLHQAFSQNFKKKLFNILITNTSTNQINDYSKSILKRSHVLLGAYFEIIDTCLLLTLHIYIRDFFTHFKIKYLPIWIRFTCVFSLRINIIDISFLDWFSLSSAFYVLCH